MSSGSPANLNISELDLKWLAHEVEQVVAMNEMPSTKYALAVSREVVTCFVRGRGVRLLAKANIERYVARVTEIWLSVWKRICREPGKETWFPTLHRIGMTHWDTVERAAIEQAVHGSVWWKDSRLSPWSPDE